MLDWFLETPNNLWKMQVNIVLWQIPLCHSPAAITGTDVLWKNCGVFLPVSLQTDSWGCWSVFLHFHQPVLQQLIVEVTCRPCRPHLSVKHSSLLVSTAGTCPLLTALFQWPILALQGLQLLFALLSGMTPRDSTRESKSHIWYSGGHTAAIGSSSMNPRCCFLIAYSDVLACCM